MKGGPSRHFTWEEVGLPAPTTPEAAHYASALFRNAREMAQRLEVVRAAADSPIRVGSWYRSPAVNALIDDAATRSTHLEAKGVDFEIVRGPYAAPAATQELVEALIRAGAIPDGGLGRYDRHTHLDSGPAGRRWFGKSS